MVTHPKNVNSISMDVPRMLLKYAAGLNVDTGAICRCIGLDSISLQNPEGRMPSDQFDVLWAEVAARVNDPNLGLHFGEAIPSFSSGHILMGVMLNCNTLVQALERFCRYHGLLGNTAAPVLSEDERFLTFSLGYRYTPSQKRYYAEAVLAMLTVFVRNLTDHPVHPVEVRFTHPQPKNIAEYRRIFNAPMLFAQPESGLVFDRVSLLTPVFLANPVVLDALEKAAQRMVRRLTLPAAWSKRTGETMAQLLFRGELPRLTLVAQSLAISPRQLQNKLHIEGASFQALLDDVRKQIALDCLDQNEMTFCEIAFLLGFSEQSAFNHAFRRWTGTTPMDHRSALGRSCS